MGSSDWTSVTGSVANDVVRRGPTYGLGAAAGVACYAAKGLVAAPSAWGLHTNQANFVPVAPGKGSVVIGAIRAGTAQSPAAEPFLFAALQPDPMPPDSGVPKVTSMGYLLGLSPSGRLALVKGRLEDGIPDAAPGSSGVLRRGDVVFPRGTWLFLHLAIAVNTHGDTVLSAYRSDLAEHPIEDPFWDDEPGLDQFVDDLAGFNSGTRPLGHASGGYAGFGAVHRGAGTVASFDRLACFRGT